MDTATTSNTKLKLRERTTTAQDQGLFGAPSFIANGELFWGNERLGHALAHATQAP
jgi:2-hydroxychromene-2-carboxylate isomerase